MWRSARSIRSTRINASAQSLLSTVFSARAPLALQNRRGKIVNTGSQSNVCYVSHPSVPTLRSSGSCAPDQGAIAPDPACRRR
ncbi:hypothetical protein BURKHO8Y_480034 [Burkholderia sp. 8Y]|nr:hypothetical protein BURKHO8Y_480034 [Burkholderia sp. 8Y]